MVEDEVQQGMEAFITQLAGRNESAWNDQTPQQRADPKRNEIRRVLFHEREQETKFNGLFCRAMQRWPPRDVGPTEHLQDRFRKWIIGDDAMQSRAKIFATILLGGAAQAPEIWSRLLHHFKQFERGELDADFCDGALPLTDDQVGCVFGDECPSNFQQLQHEFCPVDPDEVKIDFKTVADQLRKFIKEEAHTQYETIGEEGERIDKPRNTWYSRKGLRNSFDKHKELLKDLYIGWSFRHEKLPEEARGLRVYRDAVRSRAAEFSKVVTSCPRTLATMLFADLPVESKLWHRLVTCALGDGELHLFDSQATADKALPLEWETVKAHVEDSKRLSFYTEQFQFSPVDFRRRDESTDEVLWPHEDPPYLPLHWKSFFDRGGFGEVWRVKVDEDYFDSKIARDGEVAMKIIHAQDGPTHSEWDLARKIHADTVSTGGLLVPAALLRTTHDVCIIMPLADCNLLALMSGTDRRRGRLKEGLSASAEATKQEEHYRALVPHDHKSRKTRLEWMRNPADGLRRLHYGLRNEHGRQLNVVHGDVKNTNILYTFADGKSSLRLADFGVSASKYQASSSSNKPASRKNSMARTQLRLATNCPNFPPEGENDRSVDTSADLWGFGTFFAEFIAWMSGGPEALSDFKKARDQRGDDEYQGRSYCLDDGKTKLKDGIASWFESLIAETTDSKDRRLYQDCWNLLRYGLLVCDPEQRITASVLCDAMNLILDGDSDELLGMVRPKPCDKEIESHFHNDGRPRRRSTNHAAQTTGHSGEHVATPITNPASNGLSQRTQGQTPDPETLERTQTPQTASAQLTTVQSNSSRDTASSTRSQTDRAFFQALKHRNRDEAFRLLRADAAVRQLDDNSNTALHYAVKFRTTEVTKALLQMHPDLWRECNKEGRTALHTCARSDLSSALDHSRVLVQDRTEMLTARDKYGQTALDLAKNGRRRPLAEFLRRSV